jgi:hypothetical protein
MKPDKTRCFPTRALSAIFKEPGIVVAGKPKYSQTSDSAKFARHPAQKLVAFQPRVPITRGSKFCTEFWGIAPQR